MSSSEVKMYRQRERKITVSLMHASVICNHCTPPPHTTPAYGDGIQIKFSWSWKSHLKLNIIRDEIWIMTFYRPLFWSQPMYEGY